jgi:hypothetical protein
VGRGGPAMVKSEKQTASTQTIKNSNIPRSEAKLCVRKRGKKFEQNVFIFSGEKEHKKKK